MLNALASIARRSVMVCVASAGVMLAPGLAQARGGMFSGDGLDTVVLADLPAQGRKTYALILDGGPFPHDKDGVVFGNRERILPRQKRGYYREYTVKTPGSRDRGARRIVCGGQVPTVPDTCYYTSDHYSSFRRIVNE
ncbi:ribonuclease domain-containing protein [Comamonas odontotermitis]|uniref:ribonuclease domain-containing protein n=1 Tax=Comamonas odontotermitis TaxID=379895 RepID=UPI001CC55C0A|nr:ribonuclease [Comamonas odontotermitis]UBB17146.1 ribonuclease [Comamonas odontotermitis]